MQLRHGPGRRATQLQAEQVGEQAVVAEPRPVWIERDHERAGVLEVEQDPLRPGAAEHQVRERSAHPLQDRGPEEELPNRL
jgi:hypothetical protein